MKLRFLIVAASLFSASSVLGQNIVYTGPGPRKVIIEEFTGVNCSNCPAGHAVLEDIFDAYPNDEVFAISYSPSNSNFTAPNNGAADFRRTFLNDFYATSYCSPNEGDRFMPSAFINRQLWDDGDRLQGRTLWEGYVDDVAASGNSPMNIGISSSYDVVTAILTVDVEIYYHTTVAEDNSFYVFLAEHDLSSEHQSGSAMSPYIYETNVFRETITTGTWGDPVTGPTTAGSLFSTQLTFDMANAQDSMFLNKLDVLAFIIEDESTEVYTGIQVAANGGSGSTGTDNVGIFSQTHETVSFHPNPAIEMVTITGVADDANISVLNSLGQVVASIPNTGRTVQFPIDQLDAGNYIIQVMGSEYFGTAKLIKQ